MTPEALRRGSRGQSPLAFYFDPDSSLS
jgi:hypothetical protein